MKKLFTLFVLSFIAMATMAVPARPGVWRTISLADGTQVKVQLIGDEFMHFYQSADGTRYQYDEASGCYQVLSESSFATTKRKAMARRAKLNAHRVGQKKTKDASIFQGTKKGLVILAEFTDSKFQADHNLALYNKVINGDHYTDNGFVGSVKDYFKDQSQGQFVLDFDVVGICPLTKNYSYYGRNVNGVKGNDAHAGTMVAEACQWAYRQGVDFSKYDWDGDGEADQVFVVYAGKGEADGGATSTIWPHMYMLSESDYGSSLTFDGVKVDTYACGSELNGDGELDGIGTFCHEFSHCMGFPDLYDTNYSGWFGMDDYDLMCSGSYNGNGRRPAGYSAYEKHECGWITLHDVTNIEEDTPVTGLQAISEGGDAYILKNKAHEDEYYIVENRQQTGWDTDLPDAGVMITYVDYDPYVWYYNVPNTRDTYVDANGVERTNDHQRVTIFRAGNSSSEYSTTSDLYPYGNNNSLTATTKPAATLYNKNSDGTKYMHIDIKDIAVASDGTASLTFSKADRSNTGGDSDTPVTPDGATLFYESFNKCSGTGGNDGKWSGSEIANATASSANYDCQGWTSTGKIFEGNQCVRLGNSSTPGNITSPTFTVNGSATLSFKAGAWDGSKDGTSLTISISDGTLSKTTVPLTKGAWGQYGANINANGNVKLTFTAASGRFFLDEVKVVDPSVDGIEETELVKDAAIVGYYSLDGTVMANPRPGVCIVRYANGEVRKILVRK